MSGVILPFTRLTRRTRAVLRVDLIRSEDRSNPATAAVDRSHAGKPIPTLWGSCRLPMSGMPSRVRPNPVGATYALAVDSASAAYLGSAPPIAESDAESVPMH